MVGFQIVYCPRSCTCRTVLGRRQLKSLCECCRSAFQLCRKIVIFASEQVRVNVGRNVVVVSIKHHRHCLKFDITRSVEAIEKNAARAIIILLRLFRNI